MTVSFRALGATAVIATVDRTCDDDARVAVERELDAIDRACSRFRTDSELSRVNRAGGERVAIGPRLVEALRIALDAARNSGGLVDPTVGRTLRMSGYDATFRVVAARDGDAFCAEFCAVPGWQTVELDDDAGTVRVPAGVELDLGATAKALACDRAATAAAAVAGGALVGLGGDISVAGATPAGGWPVRIADDHAAPLDAPGPTVALEAGGLATSSTTVRRWRAGTVELHHLVDPRTGRPTASPWRTVSVAAQTCVDANIASTASFLLDDAPAWLEAHRLPARLVAVGGETVAVAGWPEDAACGSHALWFATRGSGVVSLLLLTAIVVLGVAGVTRWRSTRWPRFVVAGLHRNLTLLALIFIALHVITTVADGYAPISLLNAVLPFTSPYRPVWLGLGAVAFDLLLALTITSLVRARIGYSRWRALHWLAYASWPVALVHGLGTGTDARVTWMQALAATCAASVVAAVLWRMGASRATPGMRTAGTVAVLALPLVIGGWYLAGPSRPGWAARAGTPRSLLPRHVATVRPRPAVAAPAVRLPTSAFTGTFTGHVRESSQDANGRVLVNISGRTSGGDSGVLWIRLQGEPVDGGGVVMTASGASYGPAALPNAYVGKIVGLQGNRILLSLSGQRNALSLRVDLRLDPAAGTATGTVHGRPTSLQ